LQRSFLTRADLAVAGAGDESAFLRITANADDLGRLYPWLADHGATRELPKPVLQRMHVALEEAVMNVAMHAYAPGEDGEIVIRLRTSADAACLIVEDGGPAFDPTVAPTRERPESLEAMPVGGLGLTLLRHYCADIGYERIADRNRLTLRFPLPSATQPGCG